MNNSKILIRVASVLIIIGVVVGGYFVFRRTLIADIRESLMQVDTSRAYAYGEVLFETRGCAGCHTLEAAGADGDVGPNLSNIGVRQSEDYIRESIVNPNAVIATDCPETACQPDLMPQFGGILNNMQVDALVEYLITQN